MTRVLPVRFSTRAADEIEAADRWWKRDRPATASALTEELQRALELITRQPSAGALARNARLARVRRVTLARAHMAHTAVPAKKNGTESRSWNAPRMLHSVVTSTRVAGTRAYCIEARGGP